jgi:hypothetical protein
MRRPKIKEESREMERQGETEVKNVGKNGDLT